MEVSELTPEELGSFDYITKRFECMGYNDISALELADLLYKFNVIGLITVSINDAIVNLIQKLDESLSRVVELMHDKVSDEDDVYKSYWWPDDVLMPDLNVSRNYFKHQDFISRSDSKRRNLARRML